MALEKEGYRVTYLPVDREGLLNLADLEAAITYQTAVVSLMWANNASLNIVFKWCGPEGNNATAASLNSD